MHDASPPVLLTTSRPWLSAGAAARVASCHRTTITRAVQRGELEAIRLGRNGHYRIAPAELEAWLQPTITDEVRVT